MFRVVVTRERVHGGTCLKLKGDGVDGMQCVFGLVCGVCFCLHTSRWVIGVGGWVPVALFVAAWALVVVAVTCAGMRVG